MSEPETPRDAKSVPLTPEFYVKPYNQLRRAKLITFGTCLNEYEAFVVLPYKEKISLIKQIERSCFNYTIDKSHENNIMTSWEVDLFRDLYHSICYKISSNLERYGLVCNPALSNQILRGDISIENLPKLTSQEMFPQKYVEIMKRFNACKTVEQTTKTSTMYRCGKCKTNKCTIENVYNRSLDEGVSLRVTCTNCGHSWGA